MQIPLKCEPAQWRHRHGEQAYGHGGGGKKEKELFITRKRPCGYLTFYPAVVFQIESTIYSAERTLSPPVHCFSM